MRLDDAKPWKTTKVFYGGKRRKVEYKEVSGVLWKGGARKRLLRLLVIRPTRYRKLKSGRWYYRRPAFLLTTVVTGTVRQLLQIDFDRWQIEVNHREEKDTWALVKLSYGTLPRFPNNPLLPWLATVPYCWPRYRPLAPNEARRMQRFPNGAAALPGPQRWI